MKDEEGVRGRNRFPAICGSLIVNGGRQAQTSTNKTVSAQINSFISSLVVVYQSHDGDTS